MSNKRNLRLMLFLWIFAFLLCATVVVLMLLRGPAVAP
jgi:hypothetical protein